MIHAAVFIYWVIVLLWLTVLGMLLVFYVRNPSVFGTTRLLLVVLAVDTSRNIIENTYFGMFFGSQYGVFSASIADALGNPTLLILPKIANVAAGSVVLYLLLLRWLPAAIREHKELDKNARDAQSLSNTMAEFVANASHELRTPLTSISGSLGLLVAGAAGPLPATADRLVLIAQANVKRLIRLVNDILDVEKFESGMMAFDMREVDLVLIAEQATDANRAFAEEYGVSIRLEMEPQSCMVRADAERVIQVFTNLLSNAIKFSPKGAEVLVKIERDAHSAHVIVRDHGSGIPKEFRSLIFGKFSQAKTDSSRQRSGSGLGLNIAAKIMNQHGGGIGFEDAPGGGTAFYFDLPRCDQLPSFGAVRLAG
jgi:signal transduction histidine kinase